MKINIDVVIASASMSLDELLHLQTGQVKNIDNFVQSEVILKSGNELIATGTLIKVDEQFCISIEQVNEIHQN